MEGPGRRQHSVPRLKPDKVSLERNSNFFLDGDHLPWRNMSRLQQSGLGVLSKAIALGLVQRSLHEVVGTAGKPVQARWH